MKRMFIIYFGTKCVTGLFMAHLLLDVTKNCATVNGKGHAYDSGCLQYALWTCSSAGSFQRKGPRFSHRVAVRGAAMRSPGRWWNNGTSTFKLLLQHVHHNGTFSHQAGLVDHCCVSPQTRKKSSSTPSLIKTATNKCLPTMTIILLFSLCLANRSCSSHRHIDLQLV